MFLRRAVPKFVIGCFCQKLLPNSSTFVFAKGVRKFVLDVFLPRVVPKFVNGCFLPKAIAKFVNRCFFGKSVVEFVQSPGFTKKY